MKSIQILCDLMENQDYETGSIQKSEKTPKSPAADAAGLFADNDWF